MSDNEHKPRVDAMTDDPQAEAMQPTDADVAHPEQPPMDDAAGGPDVDDENAHVVQQDIAETPPAG